MPRGFHGFSVFILRKNTSDNPAGASLPTCPRRGQPAPLGWCRARHGGVAAVPAAAVDVAPRAATGAGHSAGGDPLSTGEFIILNGCQFAIFAGGTPHFGCLNPNFCGIRS